MSTRLKTTPLNEWHKNAGANMADFGGYEMPLWYNTGVKNEHLGVLTSAGIFDTSHMACIDVRGEDAYSLLNYCFTRDLDSLVNGRCVYGAFLNEKGHCVDDAIVYKFTDTVFMICVNAGMGGVVAGHIDGRSSGLSVTVTDLTDTVAKMDIQGINAARILSGLIRDPETVFDQMPYFSFKGNFNKSEYGESPVKLTDGTPLLLSRSGYTGEFGFEIFIAPDAVVQLWKDTLNQGEAFGITACGLGSRDSLRAGACLPLSHQDIGDWKFINHPWEFALPYGPDGKSFTKNFIGKAALCDPPKDRFIFPFVGDSLRKVAANDATQVLDTRGDNIGRVLTCATDMGITWHQGNIVSIRSADLPRDVKIKGISCGFVMVRKYLEPGTVLTLQEGKRTIKATIVTDIRPDRTARKKLDNFI